MTFDNLRQILAESEFWRWSLVADVMDYESVSIEPDKKLGEALDLAQSQHLSQLPVLEEGKLIAVLDMPKVDANIRKELIHRQEGVLAGG